MATVPQQNFVPFNTVITAAWLNPLDQLTLGNALRFGVVNTGGTDISAALQLALNSNTFVWLPPSTTSPYIVHDVVIPPFTTLFAPGANVQDAAGAQWVVKCTGSGSAIIGLQVSSAPNCAQAAIIVDNATNCHIDNVSVNNAATCMLLKDSTGGATGGCVNTRLSHFIATNFSGFGLDIGTNVSFTQTANIILDAGQIAGTGGNIPKTGAVGMRVTSTASIGQGNQFANTIIKNVQTGLMLVDAFSNRFTATEIFNASGFGCAFNSTSTMNDMDELTVYNAGSGVTVTGTTNKNKIRGLRTNNIGVIPAGGGSNWYSSAGFSAPFFDISEFGTGTLTVDADSWISTGANAYTFSETVAQSISFTGGLIIFMNSSTTIAAATTATLQASGNGSNQVAGIFTVPFGCIAYANRITIGSGLAPGASQTYTYSLQSNFAGTTISGTSSGASQSLATMTGAQVAFTAGTHLTVTVTTSAGAAATVHFVTIQLIEQSN